jgi:hypothetical protein
LQKTFRADSALFFPPGRSSLNQKKSSHTALGRTYRPKQQQQECLSFAAKPECRSNGLLGS